MRRLLLSPVPALVLIVLHEARGQQCNLLEDSCPFPIDGECDSYQGGPCPINSDCFDCDPCQVFNLDCRSCTEGGCHWCPTDGICVSYPPAPEFWTEMANNEWTKKTTCIATEAWVTTCDDNPDHVFSDPLYAAQRWAYQLLNVEPVWREGITGKGVVIRVNDPDGVAVDHPEFAGRFSEEASCDVYRPPDYEQNTHGTAVASLALGGQNNGHCAVGIAPGATLSACLGPTELTDENAAAFFTSGLKTTHISVNAWGFDACTRKAQDFDDDIFLKQDQGVCPFQSSGRDENPCFVCQQLSQNQCEEYVAEYCSLRFEEEYSGCAEYTDLFISCNYNALSTVGQSAITKGITQGRNGLGIIYIFASGNEFDIFEDVNMEGWLNSRFTITVGAVDRDGKHASYSTGGAALFISGPGGDFDSLSNNVVAKPGGGCEDATVGTSFPAPSVAGAIALMLEVNPNLGWRDVQGILANTARKTDLRSQSWITNGAGFNHSDLYGFGVMDTLSAVRTAENWVNYGPEKQLVVLSGPVDVAVADDASKVSLASVFLNETGSFTTESVVVYLQLEHESRGDLEVTLTSPAGTRSLLHPGLRPEKQHLSGEQRWKFMTVRNYGEIPFGEWTLGLRDLSPGNLGDCVDLPFRLILDLEDGSSGIADCDSLEAASICLDGAVKDDEVDSVKDDRNGRTGRDACCVCGGGMPASRVNVLVSWKLVVYGHGDVGTEIEPELDMDAGDTGGASSGGCRAKILLLSALVAAFTLNVV